MDHNEWFVFDERPGTFYSTKKATTLDEAWDKTIAKWELIAGGLQCLGSVGCCGLCNLYYSKSKACEGCPIKQFTGKPYCIGTPSDEWEQTGKKNSHFAQEELRFLKSLRSTTKTPRKTEVGQHYVSMENPNKVYVVTQGDRGLTLVDVMSGEPYPFGGGAKFKRIRIVLGVTES